MFASTVTVVGPELVIRRAIHTICSCGGSEGPRGCSGGGGGRAVRFSGAKVRGGRCAGGGGSGGGVRGGGIVDCWREMAGLDLEASARRCASRLPSRRWSTGRSISAQIDAGRKRGELMRRCAMSRLSWVGKRTKSGPPRSRWRYRTTGTLPPLESAKRRLCSPVFARISIARTTEGSRSPSASPRPSMPPISSPHASSFAPKSRRLGRRDLGREALSCEGPAGAGGAAGDGREGGWAGM